MRVQHLEVVTDDKADETLAGFNADTSFGLVIGRENGYTVIAQVELPKPEPKAKKGDEKPEEVKVVKPEKVK